MDLRGSLSKELEKIVELNENTIYQNLWDTVKAVLRRKFIAFKSLC